MMCWRDYKPSHGAEWRVEEYNGEMVYAGASGKTVWVGGDGVLNYDYKEGVYDFWFILKTFYSLQRHAFGMYNISNAFRTYVFSEDGEGNATNFAFNTTPDSEAFFRGVSDAKADEFMASWSFGNSARYKYSCYSIAQYILNIYKHGDGMLGWGEGRGTGFSGSNIPVYK